MSVSGCEHVCVTLYVSLCVYMGECDSTQVRVCMYDLVSVCMCMRICGSECACV